MGIRVWGVREKFVSDEHKDALKESSVRLYTDGTPQRLLLCPSSPWSKWERRKGTQKVCAPFFSPGWLGNGVRDDPEMVVVVDPMKRNFQVNDVAAYPPYDLYGGT